MAKATGTPKKTYRGDTLRRQWSDYHTDRGNLEGTFFA
jgi:hypothetical protein